MPAFPPRGPLGVSSPASPVLCRHSDFPSSIPRACSRSRAGTTALFWALVTRPPVAGYLVEMKGPPRFLGNPMRTCPALRPRWDLGTRSLRCVDAAFRQSHDVGSHVSLSLRGSITRPARFLCTLHVRGCPRPCNTRFRLLTTLCRAGFDAHWVATKGFRVCFPPSQALPGARESETVSRCWPQPPALYRDLSLFRARARRDTRTRNRLPLAHLRQDPRAARAEGLRQHLSARFLCGKELAPHLGRAA